MAQSIINNRFSSDLELRIRMCTRAVLCSQLTVSACVGSGIQTCATVQVTLSVLSVLAYQPLTASSSSTSSLFTSKYVAAAALSSSSLGKAAATSGGSTTILSVKSLLNSTANAGSYCFYIVGASVRVRVY